MHLVSAGFSEDVATCANRVEMFAILQQSEGGTSSINRNLHVVIKQVGLPENTDTITASQTLWSQSPVCHLRHRQVVAGAARGRWGRRCVTLRISQATDGVMQRYDIKMLITIYRWIFTIQRGLLVLCMRNSAYLLFFSN